MGYKENYDYWISDDYFDQATKDELITRIESIFDKIV